VEYLIPSSMLTLEFGRATHLADEGYDRRRSFADHYNLALPKLREIAEALILHPTVTIGVFGPNVQLALLVKGGKDPDPSWARGVSRLKSRTTCGDAER